MKNKHVAGILAIFFGLFGMHKFYLNRMSTGFIRLILLFLFFYTGIMFGIKVLLIISLIEGIKLLTMDDQKFDVEYNGNNEFANSKRPWGGKQFGQGGRPKDNPYKKSGIEKYKEYDYQGAIEDFNKALVIDPFDNAIHFNLACAYSVNEDADKAFYHLSKSIAYGYKDFDRLKTHEGLSYIRTLPEYDTWLKSIEKTTDEAIQESTAELPDLLEQLRLLNERREKGELDDDKFIEERKKLMS